jgi:hypothetical protein
MHWQCKIIEIAGSTRYTSGECIVKAESYAGKHSESLCWIGPWEQHDPWIQVKWSISWMRNLEKTQSSSVCPKLNIPCSSIWCCYILICLVSIMYLPTFQCVFSCRLILEHWAGAILIIYQIIFTCESIFVFNWCFSFIYL